MSRDCVLDYLIQLRPYGRHSFSVDEQFQHRAYIEEYLRRIREWKHAFEDLTKSPYIDLAEMLCPEFQRGEDAYSDARERHFAKSGFEQVFLKFYLKWEMLLEFQPWVLAPFEFQDPYLPIIEIISQGGVLGTEHGHLWVKGSAGVYTRDYL